MPPAIPTPKSLKKNGAFISSLLVRSEGGHHCLYKTIIYQHSPPWRVSKARKSNQQKKDHWSFFCARKGPWSFFCYYIFIRLQVSVKYKKYMGISAVKCLLILYTYPAYFAETLLYKAPLLIQRTRGNPRTMLIQWHTIKTFMYI